jgi:hypothetical protein
VTTIYPELRCALVDAARRRYNQRGPVPGLLRRRERLRPLALGGSASAFAAAVAALLTVTAGSAPTVAQAFPILATPARALSSQPALARELRAASAAGVPSFQSVHTFSGSGYSGGVSQVAIGGQSMVCVAFADAADSSGRAGCSATATAEQQGITLSDGGEFVVLVPTGGSVELTTSSGTTALAVDSGGIASGSVAGPATITVHVGSSATTTQLTG